MMSSLPVVLLVIGFIVMAIGTVMLSFRIVNPQRGYVKLTFAGLIVLFFGGAIGLTGCLCGILLEALKCLA